MNQPPPHALVSHPNAGAGPRQAAEAIPSPTAVGTTLVAAPVA
jgi:hypothetical protein